MIELLSRFLMSWEGMILWYFLAVNSFYAFLMLLSMPELWRNWKMSHSENLNRYMSSEALPPVSVLMPAYNMSAGLVDSVRAQLSLRYPRHEVIVINDGSKDATMTLLHAAFNLYEVPPAISKQLSTQRVRGYLRSRHEPGLLVIDKENGGKADALNAGINAARYPLVVAVDADTILETDAILRLARTFLVGTPVIAAGGTIRVVNGCDVERARVLHPRVSRRFLSGVQVPEYLRAFLFGRLGWNRLGGNLIVSGAFGLFQRKYLLEIGGYQTDNVVEDMDLVVRLHRHMLEKGEEYRVAFVPDPVAWTEVPSDIATLKRQRERWHRGLVKTMLSHRKLMFNPRYGRVGMISYPFFFFGEMLAPVIEVSGYFFTFVGLLLGWLNWQFALAFLAVAVGYQMMLSVWAVVLEEATFRVYGSLADFSRMLLFALIEPFGYRQLTVIWRVQGVINALRGRKQWGEMQRRGFGAAADRPVTTN